MTATPRNSRAIGHDTYHNNAPDVLMVRSFTGGKINLHGLDIYQSSGRAVFYPEDYEHEGLDRN